MTVPPCFMTFCPPLLMFSKSSHHGKWKASHFSTTIQTTPGREYSKDMRSIELPPNPVFDDAIARKVELFGSGTGWDTVYNFGPYRDLVGQSADSLTQGTEPAEIEIVDETLYDQVDPTTGIVPALIRASVDSPTITNDTWLAVAVNGTVAATAHAQHWTSANHEFRITEPPTEFAVIVPPTSFEPGDNDLAFYRIEDTQDGPVLHHLEDD